MEVFKVIYEDDLDVSLVSSERSTNFDKSEIEKLKNLIKKYSSIILNKKNNGLSIKQKEEAWETITKEFNANNCTYRSVKQLKCKWEYMKKTARKEYGKLNRMRRQTGGGPPPPQKMETSETTHGQLKEEKCKLEIKMLKLQEQSFAIDEKRRQELHELQVKKIKLEIELLNRKLQ